jgi:mRNA interferase MazF
MGLLFHPKIGTIVICDFRGFIEPEMIKRRPAIIISPKFRHRDDLCTIVPLSTTEPNRIMPYHYKLTLDEPLPAPHNSKFHWVKGDMLSTVSFDRLSLPYKSKGSNGKRNYIVKIIEDNDLRKIRECVLHALALSHCYQLFKTALVSI